MEIASVGTRLEASDAIARLAVADGSFDHAHRRTLLGHNPAGADLADLVHALCAVHGHHPGIAADAQLRGAHPEADGWLTAAAHAFALERRYLAQLASAAGPLPSTHGQAFSELALLAQRHALEMLARSDRRGCATGAIAALAIDWMPIRAVLDVAAARFGVDSTPSTLHPPADDFATGAAIERAMTFGAQQLLAQHRALWDLLEARAGARHE